MSRTIPAGLLAELQSTPLKLAHIFQLDLLDGTTFYFTDCDQSITYGGHVYKASNAIGFQAIEASTGDVAVNTEVVMNYVDGLNRHLAIGGAYDNAHLEVDLISWHNPSGGSMNLLTGTLLQKAITNQDSGSFTVKGLSREIDGFLVELYSTECRANFGDSRCKFDISTVTYPFTVTAVTDARRIFTAHVVGTLPTGVFDWGRLKFNDDVLDIEIAAHTNLGSNLHLLTLAIPRVSDTIQVAQDGDITQGCNKTLTRCMEFDNVVNRRAEDYLPGPDIAIKKATSDF